jgi:predicted ATP-grasp superfamily ATP-dependent carboligase
MACHLQLAAALRGRGFRVERLVHGPRRRIPRPERLIERVVFHRVAPGLGRLEDIDNPDVGMLIAGLEPALADVQAEDQIAAPFTQAAAVQQHFPRRTRVEFDENALYDKPTMTQYAATTGWRVPATWRLLDDPVTPMPWIVKRRLGIGGEGVSLIRTQEEWAQLSASLASAPDRVLVQEYVTGHIVKIVAVAREGELLQIATFRSRMPEGDPFGPSAYIETIDDEESVVRTAGLLAPLGYTGICGIDCIRADEGSLVFLEVNSRAPGSWATANRSGTDFVGAYLSALGLGPDVPFARAAPRPMTQVGTIRTHHAQLGWRWIAATVLLRLHRAAARATDRYRTRLRRAAAA